MKLFSIYEANSPIQGSSYASMFGGAGAAVMAINESGGVDGHPLELVGCDDNSDPNLAVKCARQAVEEGVWAMVSSSTLYTPNVSPVLQAAGIPVVGGWLNNATDGTSSAMYPIAGTGSMIFAGAMVGLAEDGAKRISMVALDNPQGVEIAKTVEEAMPTVGATNAGRITLPETASDMSSYAQQAKEDEAEGVIFITSVPQQLAFIKAATQLGMNDVKWGTEVGDDTRENLQSLGSQAQNFVAAGFWPPSENPGESEGAKKFAGEVKAAEAAGVKYASVDGPTTINGWVDPWALALLAEEEPKATESSRALISALDAQKQPIDLFGMAEWTPGADDGPKGYNRISNDNIYTSLVNKKDEFVLKQPEPFQLFEVLDW